jgi:hypothetical protein
MTERDQSIGEWEAERRELEAAGWEPITPSAWVP